MSLKLSQLEPKLRERIQKQIAAEDRTQRDIDLGELQAGVAKQSAAKTLERPIKAQKARPAGVQCVVTIIALRRRLLDSHDNAKSACKSLIDVIAETLEIDDGDPRIKWEIEQQQTTGAEGTIIKIQTI